MGGAEPATSGQSVMHGTATIEQRIALDKVRHTGVTLPVPGSYHRNPTRRSVQPPYGPSHTRSHPVPAWHARLCVPGVRAASDLLAGDSLAFRFHRSSP